jgi:predicted nucleotidyltransferase
MVRKSIIENWIKSLLNEMILLGFQPQKVILFGSYAKGKANDNSDIDLAIWAKGFTGSRSIDIPQLANILKKYPIVELHPFQANETSNPFIEEIIKTGIDYSNLI